MENFVCIHSHFYQPPRENPWLEAIELQDSAYPYHDWNERITAECYARNTASRILDREKRIIDIVNNYARISFNFGPTLLSWLEQFHPETYAAILHADALGQQKFSGHGPAIAQVYNHMIMPLANQRDRETQIIWGLRDFMTRFGRPPEGMWLAETAVDIATLELLAKHGLAFTILAPRQAKRMRKFGEEKWQDVTNANINPRMPYTCNLPSGESLALFFYDGPISQDIAFGGLLNNGETFAKRLLSAFPEKGDGAQLVHIATDGETYGHHHRHGDMALAYCLHHLDTTPDAQLTIYGEYLERFPPTHEVEIIERTSWSCSHGVDRWYRNCGCHSGAHHGWQQEWRQPLREAMDWLRDKLVPLFEQELGKLMPYPWAVRNDYIEVILDRSRQHVENFLTTHAGRELSRDEKITALKLLEMQRHAMLMYTSCGWFFDDISGIEPVKIMQYAAMAIQLAADLNGGGLEDGYCRILERAPSNIPQPGNGKAIYTNTVKPEIIDLPRVGAHVAISSLFEEYPETVRIYRYTAEIAHYDVLEAGMHRLVTGRTLIRSTITWEEQDITFAVLHLLDNNFNGGVRCFSNAEHFEQVKTELGDAFKKTDIPGVIRLMDKHFGTHNYSLRHLFRDQQRIVLNQILGETLRDIENSYRQIYERHYSIMNIIHEVHMPLPKALTSTAEFILNTDLRQLLEEETFDPTRFQNLVENVNRWSFTLDFTTLGYVASTKITDLMENLQEAPDDIQLLDELEAFLYSIRHLPLDLDLWKAQNIYFSVGKRLYRQMMEKYEAGDHRAQKWITHFNNLEHYLRVRCSLD